MATWKKVLLEGDVDISSGAVTGNQADLVTANNSGLAGGSANVLIGSDSDDVSLKVDIVGTDTLSGDVDTTNDFLLIHDASSGSGGELRKVSVSSLADEFTTGTTDITVTGDSGTTNAMDSNAALLIEGGTGVTTVASSTGSDAGKLVINASVAPVIFNTGDSLTSTTTAANSGMIQPHGDNFDFQASNVLRVKQGGITSNEIANGTIVNADISDNANIDQDKIETITATHKVGLNAVNIENGSSAANSNAFDVADKMVFYDVSEEIGSGAHNYTGTIQQFQDFISDNVGGVANAHANIDGAEDVVAVGNNLTYVSGLDFDEYGHVLGTTTGSVPLAGANQAGIVTVGQQSFGGHKTFDRITITDDNAFTGSGFGDLLVEGNTTINGNLTVQGDTTTLNVGELNVEDKTIVAAVPDTAYSSDPAGAIEAQGAASAGGFFLQSHYGTDTAKFAGFEWKSGNSLTGWTVRDTATTTNTSSDNFCVSVMDFASTSGEPTEDSAGVGAFLYNTADDALYIRTA